MQRAMAREAEAQRERRARLRRAEGEVEAVKNLAHAANTLAKNPELLELLSPKQRCDMPELLTRGLKRNHSVIAFPIHEYWLDVGHKETLDRANREWE